MTLRFAFLVVVILASCQPSAWDPGQPEVLEVSAFSLSTSAAQGTAEHGVEEVWVYGESEKLGVYPLPAQVALPPNVSQTLLLWPGIKANGVSATRREYRLYQPVEVTLDGNPETLEVVDFASSYADNAVIQLAENFDNTNRFSNTTGGNAEVVRVTEGSQVFEGNGSGYIHLDAEHSQLVAATNEVNFVLPATAPLYLEFHYKCDVEFLVGLKVIGGASAGNHPLLGLNTTCEDDGTCVWKKMYLDLYPAVSSWPDALVYELLLTASVPTDGTEGNIWVDNFKFVHF